MEFVKAVEAQTNYHFFYDLTTVDSLLVTIPVKEKPLGTVLTTVFKGTALHFAVDTENRVYITLGAPLEFNLPDNYFNPETENNSVVKNNADNRPTGSTLGTSRSLTLAERKLYEIGRVGAHAGSGKATLAGHLRDVKSGEPVIGAAVYIESPSVGTTTDQFGYYSLTLPVGRHDLLIRGSGIKNTKRQILLHTDGQLEIEVEEDITPLKEVVIEAEKDKNVAGMQMGLEKLDIKTMRQVPTAFGETDILRVVLTLPGVKSVGEGNTGMNVRGGAT
ncbi:MAG: carboxypeptidase-like regulatory domain-containing protein, partial [Bacteroidota bacterium]|nr:carboxypeptidase-like regulatory domain-containing protein [Bacteroidota bacterium]